jgi:thiol-disulfide isomerase/thioredoxin
MDLAALWDSSFESPSGKIVQWSQFRGRPLIINFWATWCTPCVEEMPLIDRFYTENASKGWQVIGLAIDQPSKVKSFLEQHPVSYSVLLAGLGGTELAKALGNDVGALPYTIVLGADERVLFKKIGKLRQEELSSLN